jgi:hypothetical protein
MNQRLLQVMWQQSENLPFWQSRNVPLYFRGIAPIPSCTHCAACVRTRQGFPPARANTARGLDGTRRKRKPNAPDKREWELFGTAPKGTFSLCHRGGHFYFAATRQLQVNDYLREESRVLREQLADRRLRLNDQQRRD